MVDGTNERSDICIVLRSAHFEDCIDSFLPWFDTFRSHPEAKKVCLFDKPFAFEWIALHVVFMKLG